MGLICKLCCDFFPGWVLNLQPISKRRERDDWRSHSRLIKPSTRARDYNICLCVTPASELTLSLGLSAPQTLDISQTDLKHRGQQYLQPQSTDEEIIVRKHTADFHQYTSFANKNHPMQRPFIFEA
jgi:hypothetical protein